MYDFSYNTSDTCRQETFLRVSGTDMTVIKAHMVFDDAWEYSAWLIGCIVRSPGLQPSLPNTPSHAKGADYCYPPLSHPSPQGCIVYEGHQNGHSLLEIGMWLAHVSFF